MPSPDVDPTRIPLWAILAYGNQVPPSLRLPVAQPPHVKRAKQESGSSTDDYAREHLQRASQTASQEEGARQERAEPRQHKENTTGLPDALKTGIETLSGLSMDDVHVHYHSPRPAQVQALAYTQGIEIHVAPGQEQHLAHEAWHVVQQKQGRVSATSQAYGTMMNNDQSLEQEADAMGTKALTTSSAISYKIRGAYTSSSGSIIQARLPEMDEEFVKNNREMAQEIVLHGLNNLSDDERKEIGIVPKNLEKNRETIKSSEGEELWFYYKKIKQFTGEGKRYKSILMMPDIEELNAIEMKTINSHIEAWVIPALEGISKDDNLQRFIFGPDYNSGLVGGVFRGIAEALHTYVNNKTSPIVKSVRYEHNQWIGVGALTNLGSVAAKIGQGDFKKMLEGDAWGMATLVHEFSHSVAKTKDIAYDMNSMEKLTTVKRMKNAETYAQTFLEHVSASDKRRHYDPEKVVDTEKEGGETPSENIQKRLVMVREILTKMWNQVDNMYGLVKLLVESSFSTEVAFPLQKPLYLATYPYKPDFFVHPDITMALLEDRARVLHNLFKAGGDLRPTLRGKVSSEIMKADIKGEKEYLWLTAQAICDKLNMNEEIAQKYVEGVLRIKDTVKSAQMQKGK